MAVDIVSRVQEAVEKLKNLNPEINDQSIVNSVRPHKLKKVLVANRGEIAKRFFLSLHEENIPSVAVVTEVDRGQSWYEFADEVVFIGEDTNYTNIPVIIGAAALVKANAVYAGYGFLSENTEFVETVEDYSRSSASELIFMGPTSATMKVMGDKVSSRELAKKNGVPMFESSSVTFTEPDIAPVLEEINKVGYPVIVKLSAGGGGKGMYPIYKEEEIKEAVESCVRIGKELYDDPRFYIEKFIQDPIHIEVQVFNNRAVGLRKCAVQRRNQKIIEESGHSFLPDHMIFSFFSAAERLALVSGYSNCGAGTVEFLIDSVNGSMGFMEMNTRLQVEYGVTDQSLDIDLVKWQILHFDGRDNEIEDTAAIKYRYHGRKHSIECRIYAEEPENNYRPSPGTITEVNLPSFNGIRCDFGFMDGDRILSMYDPMIGKLIAFASNRKEALIRMERALQELYIKGVKTNVNQLLRIMRHEKFKDPDYTNKLIDQNDDLSFTGPDQIYLDAAKSKGHIIFGALSEYLEYFESNAERFSVIASSRGILDTNALDFPYRFNVEFEGERYGVEFIHESLKHLHVILNGRYQGRVTLENSNEESDDFVVTFNSQIRRVRAERHIGFSIIRMKDDTNKFNYYRMSIIPEGVEEADTTGHVTSPFQGSFVSFCNDLKVGDTVKEGDRLCILSAMKMETVITAPVSGTVSYVIEDGDISKLQVGTTSDGRVIGKSMQEGEILFRIASDESEEEGGSAFQSLAAADTDNTFELLLSEDGKDKLAGNILEHFDELLPLFIAMIKGFLRQPVIIEKLKDFLHLLSVDQWKSVMTRERSDEISLLIQHYINIRRLYSFVVSAEGFSYPDELDLFINGWDDPELEISPSVVELIGELFDSFGIARWTRGSGNNPIDIYRFLHLVALSLVSIRKNWGRIGKQVNVLGNLDSESPLTARMLKKLVEHTGHQIDDSSERFLKKVIETYFPKKEAELLTNDESAEQGETHAASCDECTQLANIDEVKGLPSGEYLYKLLGGGKKNFENLIYDPSSQLLRVQNDDSVSVYYLKSHALDNEKDREALISELAERLNVYEKIATPVRKKSKRFELLLLDSEFSFNEEAQAANSYKELNEIAVPLNKLLITGEIECFLIHTKLKVIGGESKTALIKGVSKNSTVAFDLFFEDDPRNPYSIDANDIKDARMYSLDKWPIERWAEEMFDGGKFGEVILDYVDKGEKSVGAKIFTGNINGRPACFLMKDFRIAGGATGSREGLKYAAACYLSYMKGWPLYVWNDSAGANIKEGMVSLNRGGQGFMMNSLLVQNVPFKKFRNYVENIYDADVKAVINEVNSQFSLSLEKREGEKTMVVAISIGASAGLDVYGASQATIQIILDSENSYRVLTGSNVIKSVMGEDISNYDIGGAVILGKWTGIVDLVAKDKLDMLRKLMEIHYVFGKEQQASSIKRVEKKFTSTAGRYSASVIDEATIKNNVDNGRFFQYKGRYFGSGALIGGYAMLGGKRALILGARTNSGSRSTACVVKGRELLRMAYRTSTPQILVYGDNWIRKNTTNAYLRTYFDFMNTLNSHSSHRIHIVTSVKGLQNFQITATADVVIFVNKEKMSDSDRKIAAQNSTFVVNSLEEAFDYSARLLAMLETRSGVSVEEPSGLVTIPDDKGEPFEVVESVISPVFDKESFLEFYEPFNQPAGPNLVTGLARLGGELVGIIADQPKIKGGGADALGTEKFRVFTEFCNNKNVPIVMLSNSSGFVPGSQQERWRIQAVGAESLDANVLGEVPVVSVILNQNFGGRQIHAFSKALRPGIYYTARDQATLAVMGATAAYDLLGTKTYKALVEEGKKDEADRYREEFLENYLTKARADHDALDSGVVDAVFSDVNSLRSVLVEGLKQAKNECERSFC